MTKRREMFIKDAACVDVDGVVQPERFRHRRVPIDDQGFAAVVRSPVIANGQAELIRLACGLTEQRKLADCAGTTAMQTLSGPHERPPACRRRKRSG